MESLFAVKFCVLVLQYCILKKLQLLNSKKKVTPRMVMTFFNREHWKNIFRCSNTKFVISFFCVVTNIENLLEYPGNKRKNVSQKGQKTEI